MSMKVTTILLEAEKKTAKNGNPFWALKFEGFEKHALVYWKEENPWVIGEEATIEIEKEGEFFIFSEFKKKKEEKTAKASQDYTEMITLLKSIDVSLKELVQINKEMLGIPHGE